MEKGEGKGKGGKNGISNKLEKKRGRGCILFRAWQVGGSTTETTLHGGAGVLL